MSLFVPLRFLAMGSRTRLIPASTRAMHSPFGAMTPRADAPTDLNEPPNDTRVHVVASASGAQFNGVPLGAYQVSTPYAYDYGQPRGAGAAQAQGDGKGSRSLNTAAIQRVSK